jgi:amidase
MDNIVHHTVSQLASAIREKRFTCVQVVQAFIDRINKHNDTLHVIVTSLENEALQRAQKADEDLAKGIIWGPLHGVPVTIKDSWQTKGIRTTSK